MFQTRINIFRFEFFDFFSLLVASIKDMPAYVFIPITSDPSATNSFMGVALVVASSFVLKCLRFIHSKSFLLWHSYSHWHCVAVWSQIYHNVHSMQKLSIKHQVSNELRFGMCVCHKYLCAAAAAVHCSVSLKLHKTLIYLCLIRWDDARVCMYVCGVVQYGNVCIIVHTCLHLLSKMFDNF